MKTKAFIFFSLLICNLLPAQNVKLDIVPHFFGVRADSLFLSMDISVHIKDMDSKSAFILTPVLTSQEKRVSLPHIQLNGKQKQKLYLLCLLYTSDAADDLTCPDSDRVRIIEETNSLKNKPIIITSLTLNKNTY